jgi:hypothetical protein
MRDEQGIARSLIGGRHSGTLKLDRVVYRIPKLLFAAEVTLCRLDGCVAEQKLNLLQLAACQMAQPSASSPHMPHSACSSLDYAECRIMPNRITRAARTSLFDGRRAA